MKKRALSKRRNWSGVSRRRRPPFFLSLYGCAGWIPESTTVALFRGKPAQRLADLTRETITFPTATTSWGVVDRLVIHDLKGNVVNVPMHA